MMGGEVSEWTLSDKISGLHYFLSLFTCNKCLNVFMREREREIEMEAKLQRERSASLSLVLVCEKNRCTNIVAKLNVFFLQIGEKNHCNIVAK